MDARQLVAAALATVFAAIAALHVYWAARVTTSPAGGVSVGGAVPVRADGAPLFQPGRLGTLVVAVLLTAAAALVLGRAHVVAPLAPPLLYHVGTWVLGAVLLLRAIGEFRYVGLFKRERGTRFASMDTWLYTPLCAALAAGVLYLAAT
jgi:hypothetical protein